MSSIAASHPSQADGVRGYVANVSQALRTLASAIVSFIPEKSADAVSSVAQSREYKSMYELYRMAGRYETLSPNLANELRAIACRQN